MPLYEFRCTECGKVFEELLRARERPKACPACGEKKVSKMLSGFSVKAQTAHGSHSRGEEGGCGNCASNPYCSRNAKQSDL